MIEPADVDPDAQSHDRARLRTQRRVALGGVVVTLVATIVSGVAGLSGRFGLALLLAGSSLACGVAGMVGLLQGLVDEWRRRPVGRRRVALSLAWFAVAALLLVFAGGVLR